MIRSPFAPLPTVLDQLFREIDQHLPPHGASHVGARRPQLLITERDSAYRVRVDLPGVTKDDVTLTFEDGVLTVSGTRRLQLDEGERVLRSDLVQGPFHAAVRFARPVAADRLSATFENGRLVVDLPKRDEDRARTIPIGGDGR